MDTNQLRRLEAELARAVRRKDTDTYAALLRVRDGALHGRKDQGQWKPRLKEDWND